MSNDLKSFPSNKEEALTLLFLQNQDLSTLSPEEIAKEYEDAKLKIHKFFNPNDKNTQQIRY
ncbi:hypothetical protein ACSSP6_005147 [Escherichia coli]